MRSKKGKKTKSKTVVFTKGPDIDDFYWKEFGCPWEKFIDKMIKSLDEPARFRYESYQYSNGIYQFRVSKDFLQRIELSPGDPFCMQNGNHLEPVGQYVGVEFDGDFAIISIQSQLYNEKREEPPKKGVILLYRNRQKGQYIRQKNALERFKNNEVNNRLMKGYITGIVKAERSNSRLAFFDRTLNPDQKSAVQKCLDENCVTLVQGPPGTGKTRVLVEVIKQLLNTILSPKILIVSQSHSAVDKILEDLIEQKIEPIVRIGDKIDISDMVYEKYSLTAKVEREKEGIKNRPEQLDKDLQKRLIDAGVKEDDYKRYDKLCGQYENNLLKFHKPISSQKSREYEQLKIGISTAEEAYPQIYRIRKWYKKEKGELASLEQTTEQKLMQQLINEAAIYAGTCSGFMNARALKDMEFDYVIIDEAAKATFPEMAISLVKAQKAILVGDHQQLEPVFDEDTLTKSEINDLKKRGFGKIFDLIDEKCKHTLTMQYRMHPTIGSMIGEVFYDGVIQNGIHSNDRILKLISTAHQTITYKPITWISTSHIFGNSETKAPNDSNKLSYSNDIEIDIIEKVCKILKGLKIQNYSIGIISPYKRQINLIKKRVSEWELGEFQIEIDTVDSFQGNEKDIIIYSTVRSNKTGNIGFLEEPKRLNVSFSRAKYWLIIIGDIDFLSEIQSSSFPRIIEYINRKQKCEIIDL